MWQDMGAALALVLVVEGMLPFLNPQRFRASMLAVIQFTDRGLRTLGLVSMLAGVILLAVVRS